MQVMTNTQMDTPTHTRTENTQPSVQTANMHTQKFTQKAHTLTKMMIHERKSA